MSDKSPQIDGSLAHYLIDAAGHFAKLDCKLNDLQYGICFRDDDLVSTYLVRKHLRELLSAIKSIEYCLRKRDDDKDKVVSLEEQRKNADR